MKKKFQHKNPNMPLRLNQTDRDKLERLAKKDGISKTDWIRNKIRSSRE